MDLEGDQRGSRGLSVEMLLRLVLSRRHGAIERRPEPAGRRGREVGAGGGVQLAVSRLWVQRSSWKQKKMRL